MDIRGHTLGRAVACASHPPRWCFFHIHSLAMKSPKHEPTPGRGELLPEMADSPLPSAWCLGALSETLPSRAGKRE